MNIPVLMYHDITDDKKNKSAVYYKDFFNQIKILSDLNYKSFNLKDINKENYKKKIIITFDDGYENVSKIALDILGRFNQKATCFIVLNKIDNFNNWNNNSKEINTSKLMNKSQINEWINMGYEIGSHTLDHIDLTQLNYENKKKQITKSFFKLNENFGIKPVSFSYPYGKYDKECIDILKENFTFAVTTKKSLYNNKKYNNYEIPRVSIGPKNSIFKFLLKTLTIYENLKF